MRALRPPPSTYTRTDTAAAPANANQTKPHEGRRPEEAGRGHDGGRRAGVHPHEAGFGERVAGEGLHDRAGHAQGEPGKQAHEGARQPDVGDEDVVAGAGVVEHAVPDVRQGQRFGAHRDARGADQQQDSEGQQQPGDPQGGAPAVPHGGLRDRARFGRTLDQHPVRLAYPPSNDRGASAERRAAPGPPTPAAEPAKPARHHEPAPRQPGGPLLATPRSQGAPRPPTAQRHHANRPVRPCQAPRTGPEAAPGTGHPPSLRAPTPLGPAARHPVTTAPVPATVRRGTARGPRAPPGTRWRRTTIPPGPAPCPRTGRTPPRPPGSRPPRTGPAARPAVRRPLPAPVRPRPRTPTPTSRRT